MVVVAMVGVLASISIPNYMHFAAKAKQAEAKIALSSAYMAERAFSVENGSFTYCLRQAGYVPEGANRYYMVGASAYSHPVNLCGPAGTDDCRKFRFTNTADCSSPNSDCCNYSDINVVGNAPLSFSDVMYGSSVMADSAYHSTYVLFLGPSFGGIGLDTNVTQNTFLLGAAGNIFPVNAPNYWTSPIPAALRSAAHGATAYDAWTIDQDRKLANPYPGF
jgi:Tfp pilus assembly protein PilE